MAEIALVPANNDKKFNIYGNLSKIQSFDHGNICSNAMRVSISKETTNVINPDYQKVGNICQAVIDVGR